MESVSLRLFVGRAESCVCIAWRRTSGFLFEAVDLCSVSLKERRTLLAPTKIRNSMSLLGSQRFAGGSLLQNIQRLHTNCSSLHIGFKKRILPNSSAASYSSETVADGWSAVDKGAGWKVECRSTCSERDQRKVSEKGSTIAIPNVRRAVLKKHFSHALRLGGPTRLAAFSQQMQQRFSVPSTPSTEHQLLSPFWQPAARSRESCVSSSRNADGSLESSPEPKLHPSVSLKVAEETEREEGKRTSGETCLLQQRLCVTRQSDPYRSRFHNTNHYKLAQRERAEVRLFQTATQSPCATSSQSKAFLDDDVVQMKKPSDERRAEGETSSEMSWREIMHVFGFAALPMVGFGLMDQLIMIRLGDLLDTTLGVTFGLATLSAAAVGQLCSDTAGVLFGNSIESFAQRMGLSPPNLRPSQMASTAFSLSKTLGAATGVCVGCLLGMLQLLVLDLEKADRLKHQRQLDTIFETVMIDGPLLFHCERAALFVYDSSRDEVWSKAVFGQDEAIRMHKSKSKSIVTWVIDNKDILNTADAPQDPRFNAILDQNPGHPTRSVLAAPVLNPSGDVVATLVFFNKHPWFGGKFSADDERMVEMMSRHVQLFMEKFEYGAADDRRMISLPENECVNRYHDAANRRANRGDPPLVLDSIEKRACLESSPTGSVKEPRWSTHRLDSYSYPPSEEEIQTKEPPCTATASSDETSASEETKAEKSRRYHGLGFSEAPTTVLSPLYLQAASAGTVQKEESAHCGVLLHSFVGAYGTERPEGKSPSTKAAAAAVSAAAANAVSALASGVGVAPWWSGWTFWLSPEDEREMLAPSASPPTSRPVVATDALKPSQPSQAGGVRRRSEASSGERISQEQWDAPPPYWNATFPHLYETRRTGCAKIVEVDRC